MAVERHNADMSEGTSTVGTNTDTNSPENNNRYLTSSAIFGTDTNNTDRGINLAYLTTSEGEER